MNTACLEKETPRTPESGGEDPAAVTRQGEETFLDRYSFAILCIAVMLINSAIAIWLALLVG